MARRYKKDDYSFEKAASSLAGLYAIYLFSLWFTDKPKFYEWMIYNVLILIALVAGIFAWREFQSRRKKKKISDLLISVRQTGSKENISNFINSFGYEKKTEKIYGDPENSLLRGNN